MKMKMNMEKKIRFGDSWDMWTLLQIALVLVCVVPTLATCFYILPSADDFSNTYRVKEWMGDYHNSYFLTALARTVDYYKTAGGYYFAGFINLFLSPYLRFGTAGLRVFCFILNAVLYVSLYFGVKVSVGYWMGIHKKNAVFPIYFMLLLCFTNVYLNAEASFWYCVLSTYVLGFSLMICGAASFMKALGTGKKRWIAAASVLGFLVSGSSLNLAALNGFIYLLVGAYGFFILKSRKTSLICFGITFAGALLNLAAPGNYVRHGMISNEYNIFRAVALSARFVGNRLYGMFTNKTLLPFILVALFCYVLVRKEKVKIIKWLHPLVLAAVLMASLVVIVFPVYLGYAVESSKLEMPERCCFVQDGAMYLFLFVIVIYLAGWLKEKLDPLQLKKEGILILSIVGFLTLCMWHSGMELANMYPSLYLAKQIRNGQNAKFVEYWQSIFDFIEESEEKEICVYRDELKTYSVLMSPGLNWDKEYWINTRVAQCYGKDSVQLCITDNE